MSLKASKPGSKRENSKRRSTAATYLLDLLFPFSIPQVSPNSDDLDHPIPRIERSRRKELHISNTPVPGDQHSFFSVSLSLPLAYHFCFLSLFCHLSVAYHYPLPTPLHPFAYIRGLMKVGLVTEVAPAVPISSSVFPNSPIPYYLKYPLLV